MVPATAVAVLYLLLLLITKLLGPPRGMKRLFGVHRAWIGATALTMGICAGWICFIALYGPGWRFRFGMMSILTLVALSLVLLMSFARLASLHIGQHRRPRRLANIPPPASQGLLYRQAAFSPHKALVMAGNRGLRPVASSRTELTKFRGACSRQFREHGDRPRMDQ